MVRRKDFWIIMESKSTTPWRDVLLLSGCWSLGIATLFVQVSVTTSALLLLSSTGVSTTALGLFILAAAFSVFPSVTILHRLGEKRGFVLALALGTLGAVLNLVGVLTDQVWLLVLGSVPQGVPWAFALRYRFVASSLALEKDRPRVISITVLGGALSALLGPEATRRARGMVAGHDFAGSFIILIVLFVAHIVLILLVRFKQKDQSAVAAPQLDISKIGDLFQTEEEHVNWDLCVAIAGVSFGYAIMVGLMIGVPLALQTSGRSFQASTTAIEAHMLGMFLPSLFTGHLVPILGAATMVTLGFGLLVFSGGLIYYDTLLLSVLFVVIVLVGIGWNLTFVGGSSLLLSSCEETMQPLAQAVTDTVLLAGNAAVSLAGGFLFRGVGWSTYNGIYLAFSSLAFLLSVAVLSREWLRSKEVGSVHEDDRPVE